jgi:hypothetical protein
VARKFNPLAEHGTVTPPHNGAVYYQDGAYFNSSGDMVWEDQPPTPKKKKLVETTVVDVENGVNETTVTEEEEDAVPAADPKTQLTAWLRGEVEIKFPTVRALVKNGFGEVVATKADIIDFLVNKANLVPAELVKVK